MRGWQVGAYEENIDNRSYFVVIEIAILLTNFLTCVIILVVRIWRYIKAISLVDKFIFFSRPHCLTTRTYWTLKRACERNLRGVNACVEGQCRQILEYSITKIEKFFQVLNAPVKSSVCRRGLGIINLFALISYQYILNKKVFYLLLRLQN